ncbi:hypothetical protein AB0I60_05595 [Actinosynnema sp. NPDC050436]|uniref:hypothetical protein n=1 Tax=Actinosynnema sp. NPDC050436 TaxID=3155659 RepID=UPI00340EE57F
MSDSATSTSGEAVFLSEELKALRKGRGINGHEWVGRAGPRLRRIAGITEKDSTAVARKKVVTILDRLTRRLEGQRGRLARTALGFDSDPEIRYLRRLELLEEDFDRGTRSLQRYSDEVMALLAENAVEEGARISDPLRDDPWRTKVLRTTLLLDGPDVEVTESRTISSSRDGLSRIEHSITLPEGGPTGLLDPVAMNLRAGFGADFTRLRRVTSNRVVFEVLFGRTLSAGEEHGFEFRLRLPVMSPFYLCTPIYPCEEFELKIRFDRNRLPTPILVVDGALAHETADPAAAMGAAEVDSAGQVHHMFTHLRPGRSYGLRWQPPVG